MEPTVPRPSLPPVPPVAPAPPATGSDPGRPSSGGSSGGEAGGRGAGGGGGRPGAGPAGGGAHPGGSGPTGPSPAGSHPAGSQPGASGPATSGAGTSARSGGAGHGAAGARGAGAASTGAGAGAAQTDGSGTARPATAPDPGLHRPGAPLPLASDAPPALRGLLARLVRLFGPSSGSSATLAGGASASASASTAPGTRSNAGARTPGVPARSGPGGAAGASGATGAPGSTSPTPRAPLPGFPMHGATDAARAAGRAVDPGASGSLAGTTPANSTNPNPAVSTSAVSTSTGGPAAERARPHAAPASPGTGAAPSAGAPASGAGSATPLGPDAGGARHLLAFLREPAGLFRADARRAAGELVLQRTAHPDGDPAALRSAVRAAASAAGRAPAALLEPPAGEARHALVRALGHELAQVRASATGAAGAAPAPDGARPALAAADPRPPAAAPLERAVDATLDHLVRFLARPASFGADPAARLGRVLEAFPRALARALAMHVGGPAAPAGSEARLTGREGLVLRALLTHPQVPGEVRALLARAALGRLEDTPRARLEQALRALPDADGRARGEELLRALDVEELLGRVRESGERELHVRLPVPDGQGWTAAELFLGHRDPARGGGAEGEDGGADDDEAWRVVLGVDLSRLGPVRADLWQRPDSLMVRLTVERPETARRLRAAVDGLEAHLAAEGARVVLTVVEDAGGTARLTREAERLPDLGGEGLLDVRG